MHVTLKSNKINMIFKGNSIQTIKIKNVTKNTQIEHHLNKKDVQVIQITS